jgi:hypothetical protein
MSVELLDETQPWKVAFPAEDVHVDRRLEARDTNGDPRFVWKHSPLNGRWYGRRTGGPSLSSLGWGELLAFALNQGWTLHSLPAEGGGGDSGN